MPRSLRTTALIACLFCCGPASRAAGGKILVEEGSSTRLLFNRVDPGIGSSWTGIDFDDASWDSGRFGIGFDNGERASATALIRTRAPQGVESVYCRTTFEIPDVSAVENLFLGVDYDDGFAAWINGVEVLRSDNLDQPELAWNARPSSHESGNHADPEYAPWADVSDALPVLRRGENVLALAVWNHKPTSTDLVLVPQLIANQPAGTFVTRGPYLQTGTDSSIIVRWSTDLPTDSRVRFGASPGDLGREVVDTAIVFDHRVTLTGLTSDTAVYYAVGTATTELEGDDADHVFRTAPLPGDRRPVRILAFGDSGSGRRAAGRVRDAFDRWNGDHAIDVWLLLGDGAYPFGTDEDYQTGLFDPYRKWLRRTAVWSAPGNHDLSTSGDRFAGVYLDVFDFPVNGEAGGVPSGVELWYSFDYGNVHFISLNSLLLGRTPDPEMLEWLERDLEADTAEWTIAFFHHPPYSKSERSNSDRKRESVMMRRRVLPILESHDVDLVLTGHQHAYQRSFLLTGHYGRAGRLKSEMRLDSGDGRPDGDGAYHKPLVRTPHAGTVYVVAGSAGEAMVLPHHPATPVAMRETGIFVIDIDGDRLDGRFVGEQATVRDHFAIVKAP